MPPARLPARIDRSGLGGGSFFSPAPAAGSALATGAVAAATEAIADSYVLGLSAAQGVAVGTRTIDPWLESKWPWVLSRVRNGRGALQQQFEYPGVGRQRAETQFEARRERQIGGRRRGAQSL